MEAEERGDTRILGLMMPMLISGKDDFGKVVVPPLPLLLDRVNEGKMLRSTAPFFRAPPEVLAEIIQYLDPKSLASFALVNSDSRQLARSRQFASVLLDYSDSKNSLIKKLLDEACERATSPNSTTSQPSIGACIRRITVATEPGWVSYRHNIDLGREPDPVDEDSALIRERERISLASRFFFEEYLHDLMSIFGDPHILPHLELLDWEDKIPLPRQFFDSLACSSIKHLKLYRILLDEGFKVEPPNKLATGGWPLQTLHLEVHWNVFLEREGGSVSPFCASILRLCAPTLSSLVWANAIYRGRHSLTADSEDQLQFPRLRRLQLGNIQFSDAESLNLLLGANLVSLTADTERNPIHSQCFQSRGIIRTLETFVWETFHIPADHSLDFLKSNSQLKKLSLPHEAPPSLLETGVLHLLRSSFRNLTSLCLVWEGVEIPNSALEMISSLKTLQQIHLSTGCQIGWKHDWQIDHESIRKYLASLPDLRKVALSRDSYKSDLEAIQVSHYYEVKFVNIIEVVLNEGEDIDSEESVCAVWERLHREQILDEATEYVDTLPKLEWLYMGQIPMSVMKSGEEGGLRYPVALSEERDSCWTLLRRMFGGTVD
jgi:hypothetical protein